MRATPDMIPGESRDYPEFKGYFRDWRRDSFDTTGGKITARNDADDSYLGLYKPQDGVE